MDPDKTGIWDAKNSPEYWNKTSWMHMVGILLYRDEGYGTQYTEVHSKAAKLHLQYACHYWRGKWGKKPGILLSKRDRQIREFVKVAEELIAKLDAGQMIDKEWLSKKAEPLEYYENHLSPNAFTKKRKVE